MQVLGICWLTRQTAVGGDEWQSGQLPVFSATVCAGQVYCVGRHVACPPNVGRDIADAMGRLSPLWLMGDMREEILSDILVGAEKLGREFMVESGDSGRLSEQGAWRVVS